MVMTSRGSFSYERLEQCTDSSSIYGWLVHSHGYIQESPKSLTKNPAPNRYALPQCLYL